jgi:hypothetical protein
MLANPLKAAGDGLRRRNAAGAMRGDKGCDRFSHARPRSSKA